MPRLTYLVRRAARQPTKWTSSRWLQPGRQLASRHRTTHRARDASSVSDDMNDVEHAASDETQPLRPPEDGSSRARSSRREHFRSQRNTFRAMVGVAVLSLACTVAVIARDYGGDFKQMIHLASRKAVPVSFIHVPRTGGDTLRFTLPELGVPVVGEERCYKYMHKESGAVNAILIRDPREHVVSQFSHCFSNPHGAASMNPLWGFPRGDPDESLKKGWAAGIVEWLRHFNAWHREDGYFNCFNPVNMQARYLTCGARDETLDKELITGAERWGVPDLPGRAVWFQSAHYLGVNDELEPSLEKLRRRLDSMQVVGVSEAMRETACLIEYKSRGAVHPSCVCGAPEDAFPWKNEAREVYRPKTYAELPETSRAMVMNITRVDRLLHRYAIQRLIKDARAAEKDMGKKILCAGTKRKLHAALRERGDGELEESLLVDWSEYVPDAKSKGHRAEASMGATRPTPRGESRTPRRFTEEERAEMRRKMSRARAAEVLPAEALDEVPMTHFEYTRGKW